MKKVRLIAPFFLLVSLLAVAAFPGVVAQANGTAASELLVGNVTTRNQTTAATSADLTEPNSNPTKASEAQMKYEAAVFLYESGKLDEAVSALKEANKLQPNDPQIQYMLGMVYWKTKTYDDAVDSFKRAVRYKPDWAEAHFRLGLAYYVLGRKKQRDEVYKKLVTLDSELANKLSRIINDAHLTNARNDPAASTAKAPEVVPVSITPVASRRELQADGSESNGTSTTKSSDNTSALSAVPTGKPTSPSRESNKASSSPVSSGPATPSNTTPVTRTTKDDPVSDNSGVPNSSLVDIYRVGVGDVLDIRLLNSATNRSTLYSVFEDGMIDLPIAGGPIAVAGLTTNEIQAVITSQLKRLAMEERTPVSVAVRQYASHTVIITGLVNAPGTKILRREAVPLYVLLAEVQPRLDAGRATIIRPGAAPQVVDLSDSSGLNRTVRPGDVINVTTRPQDFYYIAGRITYPGQKTFQPGITLVQAILAAGGLARDNAVISREGANGHLTATKFNLKEIKSGKIQDPRLQPGDRIEISH